jgi:hypothetical protein
VKVNNMCRQIDGTDVRVSEIYLRAPRATPTRQGNQRQSAPARKSRLDVATAQEHVDLIAAITQRQADQREPAPAEST